MINVNLYADIVSHQQNRTKVLLFENESLNFEKLSDRNLQLCHFTGILCPFHVPHALIF